MTYGIPVTEEATYTITLFLAPSLDIYASGGLRVGISVDNETPQIINIHDPANGYNWSRSVSNNVNKVSVSRTLNTGLHELKLWHVDPGVVFDKIVIHMDGVSDNTYLGPRAFLLDRPKK